MLTQFNEWFLLVKKDRRIKSTIDKYIFKCHFDQPCREMNCLLPNSIYSNGCQVRQHGIYYCRASSKFCINKNDWLVLDLLLLHASFVNSLSFFCHFNFRTTLVLQLDLRAHYVEIVRLLRSLVIAFPFPSPFARHGAWNEILSLNPQ